MPGMNILNKQEQEAFDRPPVFGTTRSRGTEPLITLPINPYGRFELDMEARLLLAV